MTKRHLLLSLRYEICILIVHARQNSRHESVTISADGEVDNRLSYAGAQVRHGKLSLVELSYELSRSAEASGGKVARIGLGETSSMTSSAHSYCSTSRAEVDTFRRFDSCLMSFESN